MNHRKKKKKKLSCSPVTRNLTHLKLPVLLHLRLRPKHSHQLFYYENLEPPLPLRGLACVAGAREKSDPRAMRDALASRELTIRLFLVLLAMS